MSKKYNIVKKYYNCGFWTKEMVYNAVIKEWITEEEYHEIVDTDYEELATYLEEKLNSEENEIQEESSSIEEIPEENEKNSNEENTVVNTSEIEERLEEIETNE